MADPKDKRDSGVPGGGAGRKDEVGRSGVYPMSGPHPKGPAEIKTEAEWGQGERGAAGYKDHGGSELTYAGGQVLGGLNVGPGGEPLAETEEVSEQIDRREWRMFLDSFSRQHKDWRVRIEIVDHGEKRVEADSVPLEGVNIDHFNDPDERLYVEAGRTIDQHLTHSIPAPRRVCFLATRTGEHLGLDIEGGDGSRTFVRFRAPAKPERLGDIAA